MKKTLLLLTLLTVVAFAQELGYEELHKMGRELYQKGDPSKALEVYQEILNRYPDDVDALLFRGRLFARLKLYDLAEQELLHTLELAPDYMDAYYALASVYYWSGQLDEAKAVLTTWLTKDLKDPNAYVLSARVAIAGRKYAAARTFIEQAGSFGADREVMEELLTWLHQQKKTTKWESGLNYEYLWVDQNRPDWQQAGLHISHDFESILVSLGLNRYLRNGSIDNSIYVDTYYKLWKKAYMNTRVQAGLNWVFIPKLDITAEVFQAVGIRHEPAIGYRLMQFDTLAAHIPSLAWAMYPGKWYLREKVSMVINSGISWQNQITIRYFLKDADTYLQLMNVLGTDFINDNWMNSVSFAFSGSFSIKEHWILTGVLSWTRDEYGINRTGGSAGIAYRW